MRIRILSIATGPYFTYAKNFVESLMEHYKHNSNELTINIFTDNTELKFRNYERIVNLIPTIHKAWPSPTLERYKTFLKLKSEVDEDEIVVYSDIDMLFNAQINFNNIKNLFGVLHPGYYTKKRKPFENKKSSSVFVPQVNRKIYLCGGVQGGKASTFFETCEILASMIDRDLKNNYIPKWHDEAYWNFYYANNPKKFEIFGPEYCWPQEWSNKKYPGKIIALTKSVKITSSKSVLSAVLSKMGQIKRMMVPRRYKEAD